MTDNDPPPTATQAAVGRFFAALEDPANIPDSVVIAREFVAVLLCHQQAREQLETVLEQPDPTRSYSIVIDFVELANLADRLAQLLFLHPLRLLPIFEDALQEAQLQAIAERRAAHPAASQETEAGYIFKPNCHVRVVSLPSCYSHSKLPRSVDVGRLIQLRGTIIRTGQVKLLEYERTMQCASCKHQFQVTADAEQRNVFPAVMSCPNPAKEGGCKGKNFAVLGPGKVRDYQEIKVQEQIQQLGVGCIPRSIVVILYDDLADSCQAGDDVAVTGIPMRRWRTVIEEERCDLEMVMLANSLVVHNEQRTGVAVTDELRQEFRQFWTDHETQPLKGRDHILRAVCPQIYGLMLVKLALALLVVGGAKRPDSGTTHRIRSDPHLLLVGDPGTGKSQFLKFASKLSTRHVLTTGVGTTTAGLTVSAVKDQGGDWMLEAGALVLADGGICCIDEFHSLSSQDRQAIHEAMEQQTISVAKAGLITKLHTRTSVLAATNSKGKYDRSQSLSVNTSLAAPLLSRFDMVFVLQGGPKLTHRPHQDTQNLEWDHRVSTYILNGQLLDMQEVLADSWSLDKLKAYIQFVKVEMCPTLSPPAMAVLKGYYRRQRAADARNAARTTVRMLESLIRISEAHARLMCRQEVTLQDAVVAVLMAENSMSSASLFGFTDALHSTFVSDPDAIYLVMEARVLAALHLNADGTERVAEQLGEFHGPSRLSSQSSRPPSQSSRPDAHRVPNTTLAGSAFFSSVAAEDEVPNEVFQPFLLPAEEQRPAPPESGGPSSNHHSFFGGASVSMGVATGLALRSQARPATSSSVSFASASLKSPGSAEAPSTSGPQRPPPEHRPTSHPAALESARKRPLSPLPSPPPPGLRDFDRPAPPPSDFSAASAPLLRPAVSPPTLPAASPVEPPVASPPAQSNRSARLDPLELELPSDVDPFFFADEMEAFPSPPPAAPAGEHALAPRSVPSLVRPPADDDFGDEDLLDFGDDSIAPAGARFLD